MTMFATESMSESNSGRVGTQNYSRGCDRASSSGSDSDSERELDSSSESDKVKMVSLRTTRLRKPSLYQAPVVASIPLEVVGDDNEGDVEEITALGPGPA
jgi:hypothetical protein